MGAGVGEGGGSCQNIWPESECFSLSGQNWGLLIFLSSSGILQPLTFRLKAFLFLLLVYFISDASRSL